MGSNHWNAAGVQEAVLGMRLKIARSKPDSFPLESLPNGIFEQVLTYLPYHELAILRRVDTKFNYHITKLLNKGFKRVERFHAKYLEEVKAELPVHLSERQNHPLYRHYDTLTALGFEISRLGSTFLKYTDRNLCCFIPGKVLDEIISLLRTIKEVENPSRDDVLKELRGISTMAVTYFEDRIAPKLKIPLSQLMKEEKLFRERERKAAKRKEAKTRKLLEMQAAAHVAAEAAREAAREARVARAVARAARRSRREREKSRRDLSPQARQAARTAARDARVGALRADAARAAASNSHQESWLQAAAHVAAQADREERKRAGERGRPAETET